MVAGPCSTAPVRALNIEPWHGQLRVVAAANATAHPWCVQTVLNATTLPAVGCATMISAPPASLAGTAPPTGTLLSATMAFTAGAADDDAAVVDGAAEVDAVEVDVAEVGAADDGTAEVCAADDSADVGAPADAADDGAGVAAAEDVPGDDGTDEAAAEDGAAADDEAADGVVLPAEAVLELPHAARVSAPAPRPAATSACRRVGGVRAVSLCCAESAVGSGPVRGV